MRVEALRNEGGSIWAKSSTNKPLPPAHNKPLVDSKSPDHETHRIGGNKPKPAQFKATTNNPRFNRPTIGKARPEYTKLREVNVKPVHAVSADKMKDPKRARLCKSKGTSMSAKFRADNANPVQAKLLAIGGASRSLQSSTNTLSAK